MALAFLDGNDLAHTAFVTLLPHTQFCISGDPVGDESGRSEPAGYFRERVSLERTLRKKPFAGSELTMGPEDMQALFSRASNCVFASTDRSTSNGLTECCERTSIVCLRQDNALESLFNLVYTGRSAWKFWLGCWRKLQITSKVMPTRVMPQFRRSSRNQGFRAKSMYREEDSERLRSFLKKFVAQIEKIGFVTAN